jgi:hypothetical protein
MLAPLNPTRAAVSVHPIASHAMATAADATKNR